MQGVSINIFIKTGKKKKNELGQLFNYDLYGKRKSKYDFLNENNLNSLKWNLLDNLEPNYFFVKKDYDLQKKYEDGINTSELFRVNNVGFTTARDSSLIHFEKEKVAQLLDDLTLDDLTSEKIEEVRTKYAFGPDSRDYTIKGAVTDINSKSDRNITRIDYRPFDSRYTHYSKKTKGFISYPRWEIMQHFYKKSNIGFVTTRLNRQKSLGYFWISNSLIERHILDSAGDSTSFFPLYLYPEIVKQSTLEETIERTPNLNMTIVGQMADKLGLTFVPEKTPQPKDSSPLEGRWSKTGGVAVKQQYNQISNLPHLKTFRKELRNNLTPAEAALWKMLQGKKLDGRKFRRQHSVSNYIFDFYCPSEQIAIELDGQEHFETPRAEYDYERDLFLQYYGIRVLRFENKLVWENPEGLLEEVKKYFGEQPLSPSDSSPCEGEQQPLSPSDSSPSQGEQQSQQALSFAPIDILDYIYAVLHSPSYREKYKEFLKIDFPRVPYP